MLDFVSVLPIKISHEEGRSKIYVLCRTSWLRIRPVTLFSVHHFRVTSGPKAMDVPCSTIENPFRKDKPSTHPRAGSSTWLFLRICPEKLEGKKRLWECDMSVNGN